MEQFVDVDLHVALVRARVQREQVIEECVDRQTIGHVQVIVATLKYHMGLVARGVN